MKKKYYVIILIVYVLVFYLICNLGDLYIQHLERDIVRLEQEIHEKHLLLTTLTTPERIGYLAQKFDIVDQKEGYFSIKENHLSFFLENILP